MGERPVSIRVEQREIGRSSYERNGFELHQVLEVLLGYEPFCRLAGSELRNLVRHGVANVAPPDLDRDLVDLHGRRGRQTQHVLDDRRGVTGDPPEVAGEVPLLEDPLLVDADPELRLHQVLEGGEDELDAKGPAAGLDIGAEARFEALFMQAAAGGERPVDALHILQDHLV